MRARCIFYADDRATVVLVPSWLGYLFGARMVSVDLHWEQPTPTTGSWKLVGSRRWLSEMDHSTQSLIRDALDFREVGSPARWALGAGTEAVGL